MFPDGVSESLDTNEIDPDIQIDCGPTTSVATDGTLLIYLHNLGGASSSSQISTLKAALHNAPYNVVI